MPRRPCAIPTAMLRDSTSSPQPPAPTTINHFQASRCRVSATVSLWRRDGAGSYIGHTPKKLKTSMICTQYHPLAHSSGSNIRFHLSLLASHKQPSSPIFCHRKRLLQATAIVATSGTNTTKAASPPYKRMYNPSRWSPRNSHHRNPQSDEQK